MARRMAASVSGRADERPDAQPGQAVRLGERPADHHVRHPAERVVVEQRLAAEVGVGFVHEHQRLAARPPTSGGWRRAASIWPVGLFGLVSQMSRVRSVDRREHAVERKRESGVRAAPRRPRPPTASVHAAYMSNAGTTTMASNGVAAEPPRSAASAASEDALVQAVGQQQRSRRDAQPRRARRNRVVVVRDRPRGPAASAPAAPRAPPASSRRCSRSGAAAGRTPA